MSHPDALPASLVDVLLRRAEENGAQLAYRFLADGEADELCLTYAELAHKARQVAATLQAAGCDGERAMLVYQPGLDYVIGFLGCLLAGVTAVPAYPPDPFRMERTFPRFQAIVNDSQPAAILTTATILDLAGDLFDEFPDFAGIDRFATDALPEDAPTAWRRPDIQPDTLAFLQYTSGSTADPKGVMLTQGNLMANLEMIRHGFAMDERSVGVIWLPPYHDMGLIGGILEPLYLGAPCVLLSPLDFLQRPIRWLNAVSKYGGTVSGGPNFAYDLVARKATAEQKAALDLSKWQVAFNGAEPVRKDTIERFSTAFAECGFRKEAFYPCYGLAEATLIVTGGEALTPPVYATVSATELGRGRAVPVGEDAADAQAFVSCGKALLDEKVAIVDPETGERLPAGAVGEIWASGPGIAQGYWRKPEESERTFRATIIGENATGDSAADGDAPERYLRTGDLGFLDEQGNLFVAGRIKDLIIVDGRNHYPQDIELTVEKAHPAIRPGCVAAFPITERGANGEEQERVVISAEIGKGYKPVAGAPRPSAEGGPLDPAEVIASVRKAVAENHDLRAHDIALLKAGAAPKTSSGKIQRRASKAAYLAGALETWGSA